MSEQLQQHARSRFYTFWFIESTPTSLTSISCTVSFRIWWFMWELSGYIMIRWWQLVTLPHHSPQSLVVGIMNEKIIVRVDCAYFCPNSDESPRNRLDNANYLLKFILMISLMIIVTIMKPSMTCLWTLLIWDILYELWVNLKFYNLFSFCTIILSCVAFHSQWGCTAAHNY